MNKINKSELAESQFGGMALCTNEGIRFIVNTKEPYTGAIYAAERFGTCSQVVENAKQISINFPPPTVSSDCGTVIKVFSSLSKLPFYSTFRKKRLFYVHHTF